MFAQPRCMAASGILVFNANTVMWNVLEANKGKTFSLGEQTVRRGVELSRDEITMGNRLLQRPAASLTPKCSEDDVQEWVDGTWETGVVAFRPDGKWRGKNVYEKSMNVATWVC